MHPALQCLFNEHLTAKHPDAKVALVESEKTAVIAAEMPELQITVSDLLERVAALEDRNNHIYIADLLIREMLNPVPREPSLEEIVAGLPEEAKRLIEELGMVAIYAENVDSSNLSPKKV